MIEGEQRRSNGRTFAGEQLRAIAMPLGGIGTGQVALCGDGGLRQWQLFNQSNHKAFVPDSFFVLRAGTSDDPFGGTTRILQSESALALPQLGTPMVNDELVPDQQRALVRRFGGVRETEFTGAYPFARISYRDDALPVEITLEAFSPFVPLASADSSIPASIFTFTLRNAGNQKVSGVLGAALKNVVGWDSVTPIDGNACALFGGNVNSPLISGTYTAIVMERPSLPWNDPGRGQMVLSTDSDDPVVMSSWSDAGDFVGAIDRFDLSTNPPGAVPDPTVRPTIQRMRERAQHELDRSAVPQPSAPGFTVNGGLAVPFQLQPSEAAAIRFVLAWSFPNAYVSYDQPTPHFRDELHRSRLWLGTAYSQRYENAIETTDDIYERIDELERRSRTWTDTLLDSSLPEWLNEFLAAQGALIRSPTIFQTADGKLYGFEGTQGASTDLLGWKGYGGSCPLNCTHVWTYEQALSKWFPDLERTMRETDFDYVQAPEGYIPHRTMLPLYLKQLWGVTIGGPLNPALDGMLSSILKTWREILQGAGDDWAGRYWPNVHKLLGYIRATWDPDGDGVLAGEQPNTYDIEFYGTNMFIGALWLAALRAAEEYARLMDEDAYADELHALFERGSAGYDAALWNGEYYIQTLGPDDPREQQYLSGCLADQLLGQWWAHQLGLGYVLPPERVKTTLRSILKYNMRYGFEGYDPEERAFANGDDAGLVIIAWPAGGQPERPTRYHDEVWTGIEYQVAAHCIYEGMVEEGLALTEAVRKRYDGSKRNPYNDVECGDHYARAMSGWSIYEALAGYRYDANEHAIRFDPSLASEPFSGPFIAGTGWGQAQIEPSGYASLTLLEGELHLEGLSLPGLLDGTSIQLNGKPVAVEVADGTASMKLDLTAGDRLVIG